AGDGGAGDGQVVGRGEPGPAVGADPALDVLLPVRVDVVEQHVGGGKGVEPVAPAGPPARPAAPPVQPRVPRLQPAGVYRSCRAAAQGPVEVDVATAEPQRVVLQEAHPGGRQVALAVLVQPRGAVPAQPLEPVDEGVQARPTRCPAGRQHAGRPVRGVLVTLPPLTYHTPPATTL